MLLCEALNNRDGAFSEGRRKKMFHMRAVYDASLLTVLCFTPRFFSAFSPLSSLVFKRSDFLH